MYIMAEESGRPSMISTMVVVVVVVVVVVCQLRQDLVPSLLVFPANPDDGLQLRFSLSYLIWLSSNLSP
jgi:hypothetical protein